jgi:imidazolonepropionase-like amidohydrolase
LAAALATGCAGDEGPRVSGDLLLTADRVFDGTRMLGEGAVLVRGSEIVAVGELDADARRTIDLGDATILPGFIDLHVHDFGEGMLAAGVTTVRDLGAPMAALPAPKPRPGRVRVLAAGPLVTVPGGYPTPVWGASIALPVRGPGAAARAVRTLAARGAAVVKIALEPGVAGERWPMLSPRELRAILAEARRRRLPVVAHVHEDEGARRALAAGVTELAHGVCETVEPELMRTLARRNVAVVGTLHVHETFRCFGAVENAKLFVDAGGELLYGSDFGNPGIPAGIDVAELELMVRAGLSRLEAVRSGTSEAGRRLGLAPLGTLVAGAPADVIAVRGDPLQDLGALAEPILVVAGGHAVVAEGRVDLPPS